MVVFGYKFFHIGDNHTHLSVSGFYCHEGSLVRIPGIRNYDMPNLHIADCIAIRSQNRTGAAILGSLREPGLPQKATPPKMVYLNGHGVFLMAMGCPNLHPIAADHKAPHV